MILISAKKHALPIIWGITALVAISFLSCRKELSSNSNSFNSSIPDLSIKVSSSVSGFVTDENNVAIEGATVRAGSGITISDKFGYFEIKSSMLVKNAGIVTVSRQGYFKGIKTFVATENKTAFFRIKLIPKVTGGAIDATTGGSVSLPNGLNVSLPANAIVSEVNNIPYTGAVDVNSYWISPTGIDLNKIMPGDLRGITKEGSMKILATYGMAAIELTGASGEVLQIAPNKKATLTFPIPPTIAGNAPATIPLWYFEETTGFWKEQGTATKTGSTYVAEVSHFSYWNCDKPIANTVNFSCTVLDAAGHLIPHAQVAVFYSNNNEFTGCYGLTDSSGYLSGAIPADAELIIQVNASSACINDASFTKTFITTNIDIALGNIILPNNITTMLKGNVTNCANAAVTNGYIVFNRDGQNDRYILDNKGNFSIPVFLCSTSPIIDLVAVDKDALQQSTAVTLTLSNSADIGTLRACGTSTDQFINYSIDGNIYSFILPTDEFYHNVNSYVTPVSENISGYSGNFQNAVDISFSHQGIAANSNQTLLHFSTTMSSDSLFITSPIPVNISEYGTTGEFLSGHFSGTVTGMPPAKIPHTLICNFRLKRQQ